MQTGAYPRVSTPPRDQVVDHALPRARRRSRRAIFLTWLRKIHLYVGLWGAVMGLLFGATGILLNHRAILKIPVQQAVQKTAQLALPEKPLAAPEEMAAWLRSELGFPTSQEAAIRRQPAQEVSWAGQPIAQPERWTIAIHTPQRGISAEYFVGNRFVRLEHLDATPIGTLMRLHKSVGANALWVLLSDTIAGSLILLSITGLLLWTQLHTVRLAATLTSIGAVAAAVWVAWSI
jgi:hypothetical protein